MLMVVVVVVVAVMVVVEEEVEDEEDEEDEEGLEDCTATLRLHTQASTIHSDDCTAVKARPTERLRHTARLQSQQEYTSEIYGNAPLSTQHEHPYHFNASLFHHTLRSSSAARDLPANAPPTA
jgi:hypothetical protein